MARVFIGLGSNEGDRLQHLSRGAQAVAELARVRLVQMATIRETQPVGGPPQAPYLNSVIEIDTTRSPRELLEALGAIERDAGRAPSAQRWGPRPLDLDLLLYDDRIVREPGLEVPHPRLHERRFVLEPLAELAPALTHPRLGVTIAELLARLPVASAP